MNLLPVSARLRAHAQSAFLIVTLAMASLWTVGCDDSTPTCSNGCGGPDDNTDPVTPGDLPRSAIAVQGARCNAMGSELTVLGNQLFATDLATTGRPRLNFAANEGFVVYFSVCNIGSSPHDAVGGLQGIHIAPASGTGEPNNTTSYRIPALDPCKCVNPIPQRQFTAGLPTGSYTVNLIGQFDTKATITIN